MLTLGYSRRSFYRVYPNEQLGAFLEAHEGAFEHFGGHTREHLYDRTRTVCRPGESGRATWNVTFLAFAEYWGFEPRLCQPYRARTKGKVEGDELRALTLEAVDGPLVRGAVESHLRHRGRPFGQLRVEIALIAEVAPRQNRDYMDVMLLGGTG